MPKFALALLLFAVVIVVPATTGNFWLTVVAFVAVLIANPIVRKNRYFASEQFQALKAEIASVVAEHNAVVNHVEEIRAHGSFQLASSSTGQHAHLASFDNTSTWKYRRDRNLAQYTSHVHNASLQVVRNASADPLMICPAFLGHGRLRFQAATR